MKIFFFRWRRLISLLIVSVCLVLLFAQWSFRLESEVHDRGQVGNAQEDRAPIAPQNVENHPDLPLVHQPGAIEAMKQHELLNPPAPVPAVPVKQSAMEELHLHPRVPPPKSNKDSSGPGK